MGDGARAVKIILLGDPECGKTSLLLRYCKDTFSAEQEVTIDESFERKFVDTNDGNREVQVWDTAGEERFRNLTSSTYRGANGILLVYDCCNRESFENLTNWIGDIRIQRGVVGDEVPTIVVGNKSDKDAAQHRVTIQEGEEFAANHKLTHFATSALTGSNVQEAFTALINIIIPPPVVARVEPATTTTTTSTTTSSSGGGSGGKSEGGKCCLIA